VLKGFGKPTPHPATHQGGDNSHVNESCSLLAIRGRLEPRERKRNLHGIEKISSLPIRKRETLTATNAGREAREGSWYASRDEREPKCDSGKA